MRKIAIIPARGGSKRIHNKNIKEFFGKPILAYSIDAAIKSGLYDEIMVSTDCEIIKSVALQYGAKVPFIRSKENSDDFATTVDVLLEVLDWYKIKGYEFDEATCIYACAPFVSVELLKNSFQLLNDKCDCVFPVLPYSHPIQRAIEISSEGKVVPFFDEDSNKRTQDFRKAFHDAGMFYTFNVPELLKSKSLRTRNTKAIEIDELHAHDIDNENDWKLAELKYKLFSNEKL
ncbi:pseudaminic acid cytidylyltransferase [Flavobacterium aquidurense]|uniref:pseudaminic acid cytidylyltransferase n=1 Tax=Flavobacterium aquidurense TaxID=362413 RepID=UPI0028589EBD|nr:pseudaminic acid cytidylyltransferase [Flavobacterium aquidurense]MDR7372360.1 N-acylneuraminate cytidylyltransferase [Flavobacterium aquidurense]